MFDIDKLTNKELLILKARLLEDLNYFVRFFFKIINGEKFLLNWHHELIFNELTKIYNKEYDNLIINIPPRHSKTTLTTYFTAWSLAKNPESLFLYISASEKLTNDNSRTVRNILLNPIFKQLFNVEISQDTTAKNHWRTEQGGGITAATINGQITGFGAGKITDNDKFYGAIIIDDPNKINSDGSEILSNEPNEIFNSTIRSRRNGKHTPIILIQQRVFINDLSGFLLDGKGSMKFKHINLPVIYKNKPIWAAKMDMKEINNIRTNPETAYFFDAQYMQNPREREGTIFTEKELNFFDVRKIKISETDLLISHTDVADGGGDYLSTVFALIRNNKFFIIDVVHSKNISNVTTKKIVNKLQKYKITKALFESNNQGRLYAKEVQRLAIENKLNIDIRAYPNTSNKITRILMQADFIKENVYFVNDKQQTTEYKQFMHQLIRFNANGRNKNDDAPDTLSGLCNYVRKMYKLQ